MPHPNIACCVIMKRTLIANRWQSEQWAPLAVLADAGSDSKGEGSPELLADDGRTAQWLYRGFELRLYTDEAEGYYLNLATPQPFVFVNWDEEEGRGVPRLVTVSYNEAGRLLDGGAKVEGVPLPQEWHDWLASFVAEHYKPEQKKRRVRPPSFKGARRDDS